MNRRAGFGVAAVSGLLLTLVGCGGKPVVGVLLPTSGSHSVYGETIADGIRLAVADLQQAKLEGESLPEGFHLVWADSGSDPARAVDELRRMARHDGIRLLIGGATSGEAQDLLPVLKEQNVICLSPSASMPSLTAGSQFFFRIYPSDELEASRAAEFLHEELGCPTVVLFVGDSQYARGFEPEFRAQYERLGGSVVRRIELTATDWEPASTAALTELKPSAVYILAYAEHILSALTHLRAAGYQGPIVTTSAFDSSAVIKQAGTLAEGVMFPMPPFDRTSKQEPMAGFVERFTEASHRPPDILAAHGYDALRLAARALVIAGSPRTSRIRKVLHTQVSGFPGVTGPIIFEQSGDVRRQPVMFTVAGGLVVPYEKGMGSAPTVGDVPQSQTPSPE